MNFKVAFAIVAALCVCSVIATVVLAVILSSNKTPKVNKPWSRNPYLSAHATALFNVGQEDVTLSRSDAVSVGRDLALVSNFHGNKHSAAIQSLKAQRKTVFVIDGEPNNLSDAENADLIITTKAEPSLLPRVAITPNVYLPYYASYFNEAKIAPESLIKIEEIKESQEGEREGVGERAGVGARVGEEEREFAVFCYSNCDTRFSGVKDRIDFYRLMQAKTNNRVANLGKCLSSEPHAGYRSLRTESFFDNKETFKKFRWVIAFENAAIAGYVSEKLVNPFLAGSVPIYLGAPDVGKHFNTKRFINVSDYPSFEACIDEVLRIDADKEAYNKMVNEPCLIGNKLNTDHFPLHSGGKFFNELYHHVPRNVRVRPAMITSNTIHFATFADGKVFRTDRVMQEAQDSGYFDKWHAHSPSTLPLDFKEKFQDFISKNPRGYGYWIWKPVVIKEVLSVAEDNDLVVWCDSGCSVLKGYDNQMLEYYRSLLYRGEHDVLAFQMKHKASHWTKADLFETVGCEMDDTSLQLAASVLIVRKTESSVKLIDSWIELTQADPHNIDDSPSVLENHPFFNEHRHDQSCLDLLARGKRYPHLLINSDNFNDKRDMCVPLQPSRKR